MIHNLTLQGTLLYFFFGRDYSVAFLQNIDFLLQLQVREL